MRYVDKMPKRQGNYGARYPWAQIAESGKICVLVCGEDYPAPVQRPLHAAYSWAYANGYRVKTRTDYDRGEFFIQFIGK